MVEHVPDLVTFLRECEKLLTPRGRLSLVVPDKRHCFDSLNAVTSTGDVLDAYAQKRSRPPPGKIFDHFSNAVRMDGATAWSTELKGQLKLAHSVSQAKELWSRSGSNADYIDVHCWRFTPASFHLLLSDLHVLGLTRFAVLSQFPTFGCEFYVSLGKVDGPTEQPDRLAALEQIRREDALPA